ncbi:hypothetical protein NDU88_000371 [Pleurodeles waltl]|uniref:Uncharacterized protein n=1 Tax=Pleurodeles waltl TaxID=8319 RepID=A0AAV7U461_PLEWA|nr:hypothetical protein NDU88_000371 [Pleurodeles waltl]
MWHLHSVHLSLCPPGLRSIRVQIKSKKGLFRFGCECQIWAQQVPGRPAAPHRSPGRYFGSSRSLCSPLRSRVVWAISAASARHQRSVKDGGRHLGSLAALQRSEYQPQKPDPGTKSAPAALPLDTLYLRPHCQLVCRAQAGQVLPGRGEKDGSLTERLLPSPS